MSESQTTPDAIVETPAPNQPTLGIDDIKNAVKIIDFASEQGAFKGWKVIEQVLVVRNRLNTFTKAVAPDDAATTPTTDTAVAGQEAAEVATTQDNNINE